MKSVSSQYFLSREIEIGSLVKQEPVELQLTDGSKLIVVSIDEFQRLKRRDQLIASIDKLRDQLHEADVRRVRPDGKPTREIFRDEMKGSNIFPFDWLDRVFRSKKAD
jgi:hypothetical protein